MLAMLAVPAVALLGQATAIDPLALWRDDYLRWRLLWSVAQAAITCLTALAVGLPIAWVLARLEFVGRMLLLRLVMLPFVVPTLVAALGVLALLGPRGVVAQPLGLDLEGTPWLLLYGNLFFNLCLVVRAGVEALERVSASRVAAARTLGATAWRAFWRVEWPAIVPWLASALCLVFLYCFSGFGLALVLGGQAWATVDVEIYRLVAHQLALDEAASLALWTLVTTGAMALLYAAIERGLAQPARADAVARVVPTSLRHWAAVAAAVLAVGALALAPLLALLWRAVSAGIEAWAVLLDTEVLAALARTVGFSSAALVLATGLGLALGVAAQRALWLRAVAFAPLVVSPVIVAFGLLVAYPRATASLWLLLSTYALLAMPFVAKSVAAGLDAVPPNWVQAARTLGATPWRAFWRITLPAIRPSLKRGVAFAAATMLGEFAATLFLSRPEWTTLTTLIYQRLGRAGSANLDAALVLAVVLLVLAAAALWLIEGREPWRTQEATRPR
jgi:thiamine transport system permease protein